MTEKIIVIGSGGFGRETLSVIEAINSTQEFPIWNVVGVVDDAIESIHTERLKLRGYRHLGSVVKNAELLADTYSVISVGAPDVRARIASMVQGPIASPLVHPSSVVASDTKLSKGVVVCAGAQISTNVTVGRHTHINPGAIIGHDTVINDYVSINPGAIVSGEVHIASHTLIGAGAIVLQGLSVEKQVILGAGACLTHSPPAGVTLVGVPARIHKVE